MFDVTLQSLDRLLGEKLDLTTERLASDEMLLRQYRRIIRDQDTEQNFDVPRIVNFLHELYAGWFEFKTSCDSGKLDVIATVPVLSAITICWCKWGRR